MECSPWNAGSENGSVVVTESPFLFQNYSGAPTYFQLGFNGISAYGYFFAPPFNAYAYGSPAICPDLTGTAHANVPITGTYTVQWLNTIGNVVATGIEAELPTGNYGYIITNENGCTVSALAGSSTQQDTGVYIYSESPIQATVQTTPAYCTNGTATILPPTGGLAPYSYEWQGGANTASLTGLSQGYHIATITDAQGCTGQAYAYIEQAINLTINSTTVPATCAESDGSATVFTSSGTAPYAYQWSNGMIGNSIGNVPSGYYTCHVTDAIGCTGSQWVQIAATTPISATFSATPSQCTSETGTATVAIQGGVSPYAVNWSTFPTQSGTTISNVGQGAYGFQITDQNGCTRTGTVTVPPVSSINAVLSVTPTSCTASNGTAAISASGTASPFTYLWNNGSTAASLSGLGGGSVSCIITDANGCSRTKSGAISVTSPVSISFNVEATSCIFNSDGSIQANATGGTAPYTWSSGSSLMDNLASGHYSVHVTDASGCVASDHTFVPVGNTDNSCYCTISGTVYNDLDNNCLMGTTEAGIANVRVENLNHLSVYTDYDGTYSFIVPSGTYYIIENPQWMFELSDCQALVTPVTVTAASGCNMQVDFASTEIQRHEVDVLSFDWAPPVPGNEYLHSVVYSNAGTFSETEVQGTFEHDGQLLYSGNSPFAAEQPDASGFPNWYSHTSEMPDLNPGESSINYLSFQTPTNIPLGTQIVLKDTTSYMPSSSWADDFSPWNNVVYFTRTVVGSFDPNFKEVSPAGIGASGSILPTDTVLTYLVHFQNTGTAAADLVVIRDTLDTDLEFSTLRPGWSSHNYETSVTAEGAIEFRFPNINLPDSASNPLGSMGVVSYSIHLKPNRPLGTEITNDAAIYFDYNLPIYTNSTLNTIELPEATNDVISNAASFNLYPNPARDFVKIETESSENTGSIISVYDVGGRLISSEKIQLNSGKTIHTLSLSGLENGIYFVKIGNSGVKMLTVTK